MPLPSRLFVDARNVGGTARAVAARLRGMRPRLVRRVRRRIARVWRQEFRETRVRGRRRPWDIYGFMVNFCGIHSP